MTFYYKVGDKKYYNKLEAVLQNLKTNSPIRFITPYDDNNFFTEPEESLQSLIVKRLRELRDTYKEIKLYYSGGSDSHLILENIITNDIKIDEIVCLKSGIPTAEPVLKKHMNKLHGTKISIKTPTLNDYRNYFKQGITKEKIRSGAVGTHNYLRLHWPLDLYGQEPKDDVLQIRGMEKPKIIKHGNDYYTYFIDMDLEPHANNYQFFSTDKKIQSKQSHMWLQTYRTLGVKEETDIWNQEQVWNKSIGRYINEQSLPSKKVFFGVTDNYLVHKGLKLYYHNRKEQMALIWCQKNCPDILQAWYENVEQLKDVTNNKWWNDGHPEMGSVGVFTDFYCLTRNDTKTVDQLFPDGFKT
jgi:hypothetical protein